MRITGCLLCVLCLSSFNSAQAQSLSITSPAAGQRLAAGADYATDVLGDPWDMSNSEDVSIYPDERLGWGGDYAIANGKAGGTTVANGGAADTQLVFLYRGFYGTINTGRSGARYPIDSSVYKKLSFRMRSDVAVQVPQVYWFHQQYNDPDPTGYTGNGDGVMFATATETGYRIYVNDLTGSSYGGQAWTDGNVLGLRLDPNGTATGYQVFFDWVRLTRADSDASAVRHTIRWSGGSGTTTIEVIDADGTTYTVASGLSSSLTEYSWPYGFLPPGIYTLRITRGGETATRSFSINSPPIAGVTDPDETGGTDWAAAVRNNAWDMNDAADIEFSANLTGTSFSGGQFNATNTNNDPQAWLLYGFNNPRLIDTSRYRYLTFTMAIDGSFDLGAGSVARMFWGSQAGRPDLQSHTNDIIIWPGANSYTVDLGALTVGATGGIAAFGEQQRWTQSGVYHFRLDPHEFSTSRTFHIDNVKLGAIDESTGSFTIRWNGSDADSGDSPSVTLYYDTDTNASNGKTLMASGLSMNAESYTWTTTSVTPGTYYIYLEATDGLNTLGRYSTGQISVVGATTTNTLTMSVSGSGSVSSSPGGISCGSDCAEAYSSSTAVTLIANASIGSVFAGWGGDADCLDGAVTMSGARTCTATFVSALGTGVTRGGVDFNGDSGGDSFRYSALNGTWAIDLTNRSGAFASKTGTWSTEWRPQAGDFNGDGLTDMFLYNPTTGAWSKCLNTGSVDFSCFNSTWSAGWDIHIVDLNGDGKSDIFLYSFASGVWFKCLTIGNATGDFSYQRGAWSGGWSLYPTDFNGDGLADLLLYDRAGSGMWFRATNDGGTGFTYASGFWSTGWDIYPGDYNGDGRSDLFLYMPSTGQWFVVLFTGSDFTYSGASWSAGWTIKVGDLNTDSYRDIFLYSPSTGTWFECFSNGAGNFGYNSGSFGTGWDVYLTDFNGDRYHDVLLYNPTSGAWQQNINLGPGVSFMSGSGSWSAGLTIVATRPRIP